MYKEMLAFVLFFVIVLGPSIFDVSAANFDSKNIQSDGDINFEAITSITSDMESFKNHVKFFSTLGSRVTGYPGFFQAQDYIVEQFREFGVKPFGDDGFLEYFDVTVPLDEGANITLSDGTLIKAYSLWPNFVNPSPYMGRGIDRIVYVGKGESKDFNGKNVTDKFVLMDFNSKYMFRTAAMYGSKGVIYYLESNETTSGEAISKLYGIPFNFPRLFVNYEDGIKLVQMCEQFGGEIEAQINSMMEWRKIKVANILGLVEGYGPAKNEYIVISAYYDSWSLVPGVSPGATDSLGISTLLQIAKLLTEKNPSRSVILLALAGHWQSLSGAREFVEKHFTQIGEKIRLFISVDLASESNQIGVFHTGNMYAYRNPEILASRYTPLVRRIFRYYLPIMREIFGQDFGETFVDGIMRSYPAYVMALPPPEFSPFGMFGARSMDCEPFVLATYGAGLGFYTVNAYRKYMKTPIDLYERVIFENLEPQIKFVVGVIWGFANDSSLPVMIEVSRFHTDWGYATLKITAVEYNVTTDFYDPISKSRRADLNEKLLITFTSGGASIVGFPTAPSIADISFPVSTTLGTSAVSGIFDIIDIPDEEGTITVKGVKPYAGGTASAFVLNASTGSIEWATDIGIFSGKAGGSVVSMYAQNVTKMILINPSGSIVAFNVFDPVNLASVTRTVTGTTISAGAPTTGIVVQNHFSHAQLITWSFAGSHYADVMAMVPPDESIEILVFPGARGQRFPFGTLFNSTAEAPEGYGYKVKMGETLRILATPYKIAKELYTLNKHRINQALRFGSSNPIILLYDALATKYVESSEIALQNLEYGKLYGLAYAAWAYEIRSYQEMMGLIMQIVATTVFFTLMMIPFALAFERLLFQSSGVKRLIGTLIIFSACIIFLGTFHPGFYMATNSLVTILGFGIVAVIFPILLFTTAEIQSSGKMLREKTMGMHGVGISRVSTLSSSLSIAIQHMKKRRFRSTLMLVSISLIVFALISFTSIAAAPVPRIESKKSPEVQVNYEGILIRNFPWRPIPSELYLQLEAEFEDKAIVSPRAWIYPPNAPGGGYIWFTPEQLSRVRSILAVSPNDRGITMMKAALIPPSRWFDEYDRYSCLISEGLAQNLTLEYGMHIDVGSEIPVWGINFTVIGIFEDWVWDGVSGILDLDQEAITPAVPVAAMGMAAVPPHVSAAYAIVIPYDTAWSIFPFLQPVSISIAPRDLNSTQVESLVLELAYRLNVDIVYGKTAPSESEWAQTNRYRTRTWVSVIGGESLIVPLIISGLTILTMMLGAIYERIREILIFTTIGLSPSHVTGLFLTEALVYCIIASIMGYGAGVAAISIFVRMNLYPPGFFPNYASAFVFLVILITISMTFSSTIYPATKASRIVIPSLTLRWRIPLPSGDSWRVSLPFLASSEEELLGFFVFLEEYLSVGVEREGLFMLEGKPELVLGEKVKQFVAIVRLAPFDQGILQELRVPAILLEDGRFVFSIDMLRKSGLRTSWIGSNRIFIDSLRKQFLMWRALTPQQKMKYQEKWQSTELDEK